LNDRQSRGYRQSAEASRVTNQEWVDTDIECFGAAVELIDLGRDILATANFRDHAIETERPSPYRNS
jgi:hypothetical protein